MAKTLYKAKFVYPVSTSIIKDGAILVENGKIVKVDEFDEFFEYEYVDAEVVEFKNGMLLPGFVNAHTHLEYTLVGKISPKSFVDFLIQSLEKSSGWNEAKIKDSIRSGIKQLMEFGITSIGDISRWGISPLVLSEYPILSNVSLEAFSYDANSSELVFNKLLEKIAVIQSRISERITLSISPHSPYNADPVLWEKIIAYTQMNNMIIHSHIAESLDEKKWFEYGDSDIDNLHQLIGWPKITPQITSMSSVEYMSALQLISSNLLAVHLCFASIRDIELLEDKNVGIVICPRSNYNLHKKILDHNLLKHLKMKACIATDGITSAGNLNILEDLRFFNSKTQLSYEELTKMITIYPARFLRMDKLVGTLETGKLANIVAFDNVENPNTWFNAHKPSDVIIEGSSILAQKC